MQYSPKLKKAIQEIEEILKREDIAGFVVLHTPGFAELLTRIDPSYSCASIKDGALQIRGKKDRDFGGDVEKWKQSLTDTSNMLSLLGSVGGSTIVGIIDASTQMDKQLHAEQTDMGSSTKQEQSN